MRVEQIAPGTGTTIKVADKQIAVFNAGGNFYAIGDSCAHAGASLGSGRLNGTIVTCRTHGLRYDVTAGQVTPLADLELRPIGRKLWMGKF